MKKQIAKSISILSLLLVLSVGAVNVSAFPICSTPICLGRAAKSASAQNVKPVPAQDAGGQEIVPTAQAEISFSFAFFLVRLAMSFLYLP